MPFLRSGELELPATTASVPEARRFVRTTLRSWEREDLAESAALVVSELATNAVLHARSTFVVRLLLDGEGRVRVEVTDASARRPDRRAHSTDASTGRGLAIVAELAVAWGVDTGGDGKTVWAELVASPDGTLQGADARTSRSQGRGAVRHPHRAGPQVAA